LHTSRWRRSLETRADGAEQRKGRCQVLVLDDAWIAEGLNSDDNEKDQLAKRRSVKRRAGIVGVDEEKQKVE